MVPKRPASGKAKGKQHAIAGSVDRALLKQLDVRIKEVATALGKPPETIRQGLRDRDATDRERPYLDAERLIRLGAHFKDKGDTTRWRLVRAALLRLLPQGKEFLEQVPGIPNDPTRNTNWVEMWVFTQNPMELRSNGEAYARDVAPHCRSAAKVKVYFVDSADRARDLVARLSTVTGRDLQNLYVIRTDAVALSPHWVVFFYEAKSAAYEGRRAWVHRGDGEGTDDEFVALPRSDIDHATRTLSRWGLLSPAGRFAPPAKSEYEKKRSYEIVYPVQE